MTVKELIEKLKLLDKDLDVVRHETCLNCRDTDEISIDEVYEAVSINDKSKVVVVD